jgi:hypothetical protein
MPGRRGFGRVHSRREDCPVGCVEWRSRNFLTRLPHSERWESRRGKREKMGGHMIHVEHRKRIHLMLRTAGCLTTIALLYAPVPGFWSSVAWGQQSPTLTAPVQALAPPKRYPRPTSVTQPSLVEPSALNPTPIALAVANPATALGSALVSRT